ncbi:MAG: DUF192 domain-containing protein [Candidatus ainarchaeum sp.]|nr:DUF192 domain-containing protein [Candidatus ainarchaeum sp.]
MLKVNEKKIGIKVRFANTSWQRLKGLMFEDTKKFDYALIFDFPKESIIGCSIHMIFVFFPIDVLFLNKEKKVVDKITLLPFTPNYTPKKPAKYVIEMPNEKAKKIKIGDKISW